MGGHKRKGQESIFIRALSTVGDFARGILHFLLLLSSPCQIVQVLCGSVIIVPDYEDSDEDILGLIAR